MADNNENICVAIMTDGNRCTKRHTRDSTRCSAHKRSHELNGPHTTAIKELGYTHKKQLRDLENVWVVRIRDANGRDVADLHQDRRLDILGLTNRQERERLNLNRQQRDEIRRTGVDPDAQANARREQIRQENHQRRQQRMHEELREILQREQHALQQREVIQQQQILNQIQQQQVAQQQQQIVAPVDNQLRNFAQDNQNVHTAPAVEMVKQTVQKVLRIAVPPEYKWNAHTCSLTPGDIITKCKLSSKAAWQMTAKYCQDEDIYNMGPGIYGRVLDSVWQYVLNSESKEDLCKILKQEMQDNIGMCAQGNLSRLCNILSGYLEDLGSQESQAEILGRSFGKLMEIEDLQERTNAAFKLFMEVKLPTDEWSKWLNPLVEDEVEKFSFNHLKDDSGNVTGIELSVN